MQVDSLARMTKGWFVGNFEPSLYQTDQVEVAIKRYVAGESEERHYHAVATEITVIVSGRAMMNGCEFGPDDMVTLEPGESADFCALTDLVTAVVKLPCVKGDKYPDAPEESC